MECLKYPFDNNYIIRKKNLIKKQLLEEEKERLEKRIAVLGGSTTSDIINMLELFLLDAGIKPVFYEAAYGQYWEEAMFKNPKLKEFNPDIIYIHTSNRNISKYPKLKDSQEYVNELLEEEYCHFESMWEHLYSEYSCPLIQNNFELPFYRILGNMDTVDYHGKVNFISRLNQKFYDFGQKHPDFYINDINYISACYGLDKWSDPLFWNMYKYALCVPAIPDLAYNISNIIKSIFGKNKKVLMLDMDNTLWGGVIGDDGVENIELGRETSMGQIYMEFQNYIKELKEIGVVLTVNSKNDMDNAIRGLNHRDSVLCENDFAVIKANWMEKSRNADETVRELNVLNDSIVFIDDNPAERELVESQVKGVTAPDIGNVEQYIKVIDRSGFFEVTGISQEDFERNSMYKSNIERQKQMGKYEDYEEYLLSLDMQAVIKPFEEFYIPRIVQLSNKSNQFNLTTKRYTRQEIVEIAEDNIYIHLYGKLEDKFGDNGIVSLVIGKKEDYVLHIELWLMSCRVLKRNMEYAMFDSLIEECIKNNIEKIRGYYYATPKNGIVKDFYSVIGFKKITINESGDSIWEYEVPRDYVSKNTVIKI